MFTGNCGGSFKIGNFEQRVGWCFQEQSLGIRSDSRPDIVRVSGIDKGHGHPQSTEQAGKDTVSTAINIFAHNQVITGRKEQQNG